MLSDSVEDNNNNKLGSSPKTIILVGGPGSGKGTQGKKIEKVYNYLHISKGDIGRETNNYDDISKKYSTLSNHEIKLNFLKNAMVKNGWNNRKFVIDGFNRKLGIVDYKFISEIHIVCVLVFCTNSIDLLRSRVIARNKGNENFRKSDLKILEKRLKIYETETQEVINFFRESCDEKVYFIDCETRIEDVFVDIQKILDKIIL